MLRKAAVLLTIALLMLMMVPCYASANGPPPNSTITITVIDAPKNAAYIDILVDRTLPEIIVLPPNAGVFSKYPALSNCQLIGYSNDGYVSYSLYYRPQYGSPYFEMKLSPSGKNVFTDGGDWDINSIKIAIIDDSGKILQVSNTISFTPSDMLHVYDSPKIIYNYQKNSAKVQLPIASTDSEAFDWFFIISLLRILFSTAIEIIIALPFKIKPLWIIFLVNIVTQLIITVGIPLMTGILSYTLAVVVFEVFVYVIEYLAYMKFTKEPKWKRVLLYTIVANTASLLLVLIMNVSFLN